MSVEKSLDELTCEMLDNHEGPLGKSFQASNMPVQPVQPGGHVGDVMAAMGIEPQPDPRIEPRVLQKGEMLAEGHQPLSVVQRDTLDKADVTQAKAKQILRDGTVHGKPLTEQQRKYFGAIAGGATIRKSGIDALEEYLEEVPPGEQYVRKSGMEVLEDLMGKFSAETLEDYMEKAGPFTGPRGGKWADAKHTIPWKEGKHAGKKEPKTKEHDPATAQELQLVIENESSLHNQHMSIRKNLVNKMGSGKYDHAQASKLYQYLVDAGAKYYEKHHMSVGAKIPKSDRMATARAMANDFHEEAKAGEWDDLLNKKNKKATGGSLSAKEQKEMPKEEVKLSPYGVLQQALREIGDPNVSAKDKKKFAQQGLTILDHPGFKGAGGAHKETFQNILEEDTTEKSMTASQILEDWLGKSMPSGSTNSLKKPKSSAQGGSADGGSLEGGGHGVSEASDMSAKQGMNPPKGNTDKLSEDDAEAESQMKPHKKPIEKTAKSLTPQGQRDSVAHASAVAVSRLRKSRNEMPIDEQASDLVKSEEFYTGDSPQLNLQQDVTIRASQQCGACGGTFAKSLTACPDCRYGQVSHRVAPGRTIGGDTQVRENYKPLLKKSDMAADIDFGKPAAIRVIR